MGNGVILLELFSSIRSSCSGAISTSCGSCLFSFAWFISLNGTNSSILFGQFIIFGVYLLLDGFSFYLTNSP